MNWKNLYIICYLNSWCIFVSIETLSWFIQAHSHHGSVMNWIISSWVYLKEKALGTATVTGSPSVSHSCMVPLLKPYQPSPCLTTHYAHARTPLIMISMCWIHSCSQGLRVYMWSRKAGKHLLQMHINMERFCLVNAIVMEGGPPRPCCG